MPISPFHCFKIKDFHLHTDFCIRRNITIQMILFDFFLLFCFSFQFESFVFHGNCFDSNLVHWTELWVDRAKTHEKQNKTTTTTTKYVGKDPFDEGMWKWCNSKSSNIFQLQKVFGSLFRTCETFSSLFDGIRLRCIYAVFLILLEKI